MNEENASSHADTQRAAPEIRTGKQVGASLNITHMLPLPADTPYGNLARKYMFMVERLDHVNVLIRRVFASHQAAMATDTRLMEHLLLAEEMIYWFRKTADELIALVHVLAEREATGSYPTRIDTDRIGRLLAGAKVPDWLNPHMDFLRRLNDISNAYKHSFINSDLGMVGRDEPGVYALDLKWNNLANQPGFHNIRVREVVERFDAFFQAALSELKRCKLPHRAPQTDARPNKDITGAGS